MKKFFVFVLLIIILLLGACSNKEEPTAKGSSDTESSAKQDKSNGNKMEEKGVRKGQEESADGAELFDIQVSAESNLLKLVSPGKEPIILAKTHSSKPVKSPNGEKAAYLSPYDWEESSILYIVDLKDGGQTELVSADAKNKPKYVIWEDDEHVLVIIGFPHGTIDLGGDIYRVNIETKEKELVKKFESDIQVTYLLRIEDGVLYYSGIQYTDPEMNDYKDFSGHIKLEIE